MHFSNNDLRVVIEALGGLDAEAEADLIGRVGRKAGDRVHEIVKAAAISTPTACCAIGVGIHVAAQILCETLEFASRSVGGGDEGMFIVGHARKLFDDLVAGNVSTPGAGKPN